MPLADTLFRRGHLSDQALVAAWQSGSQAGHLDTCEVCLTRLVDLTRWLNDIRDVAVEEVDAAFPAERLAAQQSQIMRRLEQLDRPSRLLAFPTARAHGHDADHHKRNVPAWIAAGVTGVAAGLILGVLADRVVNLESARREAARAVVTEPARPNFEEEDAAMLIGTDVSRPYISALAPLDDVTPKAVITRVSASR